MFLNIILAISMSMISNGGVSATASVNASATASASAAMAAPVTASATASASAAMTASATAPAAEEFNREPLVHKPYTQLPLGDIKADGWLKTQLEYMRDGMTGHLDELYPQVMGPRNGWLGGDGDVWERGPYWIDGLLPLAYILDDKDLKAKVQPWIEWTLASQKENGYFGPDIDRPSEKGLQRNNSGDWWPKMVMLKVLQQYYQATGDERVIPFLSKYFKYQKENLPSCHLDNWTYWGMMRGGDNLSVVLWLYNITGEDFLLELADILHEQTYDWTGEFRKGEIMTVPFEMHTVNLAQGFKEPVVYFQKSRDYSAVDAVHKALRDMRRTIAFPTGLWAGDELTRFGNPTEGSELCAAVEMMFSAEQMLEITGDAYWGDYLERVAYNALPTQITENFDARQYYQQVNQIKITYEPRNFCTNYGGTDQLMGLLCGYPCCTSNLHQGWPKFVQNLWYRSDDGGLAALVYAPCHLTTTIGSKKVTVTEETNYPATEAVSIKVSTKGKVSFPMHLKVPVWADGMTVRINGQNFDEYSYVNVAKRAFNEAQVGESGYDETPSPQSAHHGNVIKIDRQWKNGDVVTIEFGAPLRVTRWYENSAVVERGPLVYALKMNEKWEKKTFPADNYTYGGTSYYEVTSDTPWNWAFKSSDIENPKELKGFEIEKRDVSDKYFWNPENAPVVIRTKATEMPLWTEYNGDTGPIPFSNYYNGKTGEVSEIELIPYGCTTLRITEFPVLWK